MIGYRVLQNGGCLHVIEVCDLALLITNDWEAQLATGDLIDILDPSSVRVDGVGRETDQLDAALGELWLELCEGTEFGGADGCVVLGVGEEYYPLVADELMEVDWALSGLGLEVGGNGTQAETGGEVSGVQRTLCCKGRAKRCLEQLFLPNMQCLTLQLFKVT